MIWPRSTPETWARCALLVLLGAAPGLATVGVDVVADGEAALRATVVNTGSEPAHGVRPELLYRHRSTQESPVDLGPGERREWRFPLDPPPAGGTLPAVVQVRYDAAGGTRIVPGVATVRSTGASPEVVQARLDAPPVAGAAHAVLVVENPGSRPVAGRAAFVLPRGLTADPESMPAEIPPAGRASLPVVLENDGALPPGDYPAFAILEYGEAGVPHTALARTTLRVAPGDTRRRRRPLVIGTLALGVALAILGFALRRTGARPEKPSSRSGGIAAPGERRALCRHAPSMRTLSALLAGIAGLVLPAPAFPRAPGEPVRLVWSEGDVAGMTAIHGSDGREPIGFVEYHQTRTDDRLSTVRVARFRDGSSDEDSADARVAEKLEAISGRSIIRDTDGTAIVDMWIDVAGGRIRATWGRGDDRRVMDEAVTLPPGTYWGPLIFIVLKNFDANAEGGHLVFRTVAPTPKPMMLDMELSRVDDTTLERTGVRLVATRFRLRPTIHWMIDPFVRLIAPRATFWMLPGDPPALARFVGPRNYGRQEVVIE